MLKGWQASCQRNKKRQVALEMAFVVARVHRRQQEEEAAAEEGRRRMWGESRSSSDRVEES